MKRAARAVGGVKRKERVLSAVPVVSRQAYGALPLDARLELIRELIPLGLMYVREELDRKVEGLAGVRYRREGATRTWRGTGQIRGA